MKSPNTLKIEEAQKTHWMRFDNKTFEATDNVASNLLKSSGYGYRKVFYTDEVEQNKTLFGLGSDKVFFDPEWDVRATENLKNLEQNLTNDRIVLRRLGHLYPVNSDLRPKFFPEGSYNEPLKKVTDVAAVPHFLHELGLFPASEYKSLFFTQDFQKSGMYHAVVNYNGRWETDVVDDFIPVYESSGKPIWGMDLEQPWQLILLKFWAKRNYVMAKDYNYTIATRGGYAGVKNSAPFQFVNCFSNSNWKFVNLGIDFEKFVKSNINKIHKGHFILKTKNSDHVKDSGLIPNEACYQLVNIIEQGQQPATNTSGSGIKDQSKIKVDKNKRVNYIATIRSSNKTFWAGKGSIMDPKFKEVRSSSKQMYGESSKLIREQTVNDKASQIFGLDRYFSMDASDLKNLFSCCYITTRRVGADFMSGFFKFTYPANMKKAIYLEFNMPSEGFLDFSIKQLPSNRIEPSGQSRIQREEYNKEYGGKSGDKVQRYLTNKYILVKDNANSDKTPAQELFQKDFNQLDYEAYELQYLKGYNSGDAHFLNAVKGRYILRLKSQVQNKDAHYVINYCCKHELTFKVVQLRENEKAMLMKDAMASTIDRIPRATLRSGNDSQIVAYGNTFDYIGYGYIGVKLKKSSPLQVLIDVDPARLTKQGYKLKHFYKDQTKPFGIVVKPGESAAIVLKKIESQGQWSWPPKGINIFQKQ